MLLWLQGFILSSCKPSLIFQIFCVLFNPKVYMSSVYKLFIFLKLYTTFFYFKWKFRNLIGPSPSLDFWKDGLCKASTSWIYSFCIFLSWSCLKLRFNRSIWVFKIDLLIWLLILNMIKFILEYLFHFSRKNLISWLDKMKIILLKFGVFSFILYKQTYSFIQNN